MYCVCILKLNFAGGTMKNRISLYIISVVCALAVGGLSALLTAGNMEIYQDIVRPPLAPPAVLFPIVWTILYTVMGIGAAAVYTSDAPVTARDSAIRAYAVQLTFNFLWSIIFFNMRAYLLAFVWLFILWLLILDMIKKFIKVAPWAGYIQLPYLLWVTFAGYLNLMIYILNR